MRRLEKGNNYWICELPVKGKAFLQPQLRELTDIIIDKEELVSGNNYEYTYVFDGILIYSYLNPEMKCYMSSIGNFIVTETSAKMQMVIRNHVNSELYDGKVIDEKLDVKSIKAYINISFDRLQ